MVIFAQRALRPLSGTFSIWWSFVDARRRIAELQHRNVLSHIHLFIPHKFATTSEITIQKRYILGMVIPRLLYSESQQTDGSVPIANRPIETDDVQAVCDVEGTDRGLLVRSRAFGSQLH
jgi:hypothetical protein